MRRWVDCGLLQTNATSSLRLTDKYPLRQTQLGKLLLFTEYFSRGRGTRRAARTARITHAPSIAGLRVLARETRKQQHKSAQSKNLRLSRQHCFTWATTRCLLQASPPHIRLCFRVRCACVSRNVKATRSRGRPPTRTWRAFAKRHAKLYEMLLEEGERHGNEQNEVADSVRLAWWRFTSCQKK